MRLDFSALFDDEMSFDGDPAESFRDVGDYSDKRDEELVAETIASDPVAPRHPVRLPYTAVPPTRVAPESVVSRDTVGAAPRRKIVAKTATRTIAAAKVAVKRVVKVAVPARKAIAAKKTSAAAPKGKKSSGRKK